MSLINDALKKAQNRHGDSTRVTPAATGPAAIPGRPSKQSSWLARGVILGALATLLLIGASVGATLYILREDAPPPVSTKPAPVIVPTAPPAPIPTVAAPAQSVTTAASPVAAPSAATPGASPISEIPASPAPSASPGQSAPVTPSVSLPLPIAEPAAPAIKIGTRIQAFIDRLRITSIRISDTGNKVILNDRLFRENDLVEPSLGLRLTGIQPKQLTFTDESGNTYLRHF